MDSSGCRERVCETPVVCRSVCDPSSRRAWRVAARLCVWCADVGLATSLTLDGPLLCDSLKTLVLRQTAESAFETAELIKNERTFGRDKRHR